MHMTPDMQVQPLSRLEQVVDMLNHEPMFAASCTLTHEQLGSSVETVVYRGHAADGKPVAVKIVPYDVPLPPGDGVEYHPLKDSQFIAAASRLVHEYSILQRLDHPDIVKAHVLGMLPYATYVVMEYVDGMDIFRQIYGKHAGFSEPVQKVKVLQQVAAALAYVHSQDIVMMDVKPENVIANNEQAKLIDFNIAVHLPSLRQDVKNRRSGTGGMLEEPMLPPALFDTRHSMTSGFRSQRPSTSTTLLRRVECRCFKFDPQAICGTPGYMSPELLRGERPSISMDIFSFGVLVYEALTSEGLVEYDCFVEGQQEKTRQEKDKDKSDAGKGLLSDIRYADYVSWVSRGGHLEAPFYKEIRSMEPRLHDGGLADRVVKRCCRPDPRDRYQAMGGVCKDLQALHDKLSQNGSSKL